MKTIILKAETRIDGMSSFAEVELSSDELIDLAFFRDGLILQQKSLDDHYDPLLESGRRRIVAVLNKILKTMM